MTSPLVGDASPTRFGTSGAFRGPAPEDPVEPPTATLPPPDPSDANTAAADETDPLTLQCPAPHTNAATDAPPGETHRNGQLPRPRALHHPRPPTQPDTSAPPRSTPPTCSGVSRIRRNQRHPSGEATSPINRSQNVTRQPKLHIHTEPPRGFEPRTYALRVRCSTPELRRRALTGEGKHRTRPSGPGPRVVAVSRGAR